MKRSLDGSSCYMISLFWVVLSGKIKFEISIETKSTDLIFSAAEAGLRPLLSQTIASTKGAKKSKGKWN